MFKKKCVKVLIIFLLFLISICIVKLNFVKAADITNEEINNMVNLIPTEISLDIPEVEYKDAEILIKNDVIKLFKENNLYFENLIVEVKVRDYMGMDGFYDANVYLYSKQNNCWNSLAQTTIKLKYNNTGNITSEDIEYVSNFNLENLKINYHILDFNKWNAEDFFEEAYLKAGEDYTKKINDPAITIKFASAAGGGGLYEAGSEVSILLIFKDGKLCKHQQLSGNISFVPEFIVPYNVLEVNRDLYVKSILENTVALSSLDGHYIVEKITEGTDEGYDNGYTIKCVSSYETVSFPMIIKREVDVLFPSGYKQGYCELVTTDEKDYELCGGEEKHSYIYKYYDSSIKNKDIYFRVTAHIDLGDTIKDKTFGTLTKSETKVYQDYTEYVYEVKVTDKTLLENTINGKIIVEAYNYCVYYDFYFVDELTDENLDININTENEEYTGLPITKSVTIKLGNQKLVEGIDYQIYYSNNENLGTAKFDVVGINKFGPESRNFFYINKQFQIIQADISKITQNINTENKIYGPQNITTVELKNGDIILQEGIDYIVEYFNNRDVGTAVVTIEGIGNYKGTISKNFEILPKDIETLSDILIDTNIKEYTGKEIFTNIQISDAILLKEGEHYITKYENNIDIGEAKVTITGIGNYTGNITKVFNIVPIAFSRNFDINVVLMKEYTGLPITTDIAIRDRGRNIELEENVDYIVNYENNLDVGVATATISGIGKYRGTIKRDFNILPKSIIHPNIIVNVSDKVFTNELQGITTTVELIDGKIKLEEFKDYTLEYQNNKDVGFAKLIIMGKGNYEGTIITGFRILPGIIDYYAEDNEVIYDSNKHTIKFRVDSPNTTVQYSLIAGEYDMYSIPEFNEIGEYDIYYKITGRNYTTLTGSKKLRIYGIKGFEEGIELKNNILVVKDYNNSFDILCKKIQVYAKTLKFVHKNKELDRVNEETVKTGETVEILINNEKSYNYLISILGDVNGDGKISALDYVKIKNHIMKTNVMNNEVNLIAADVNDDSKISALDYVRIKNRIMIGGK